MFKKKKIIVREHAQERAWLLSLGKGNIFAGVQSLVEDAEERKDQKNNKTKKGR